MEIVARRILVRVYPDDDCLTKVFVEDAVEALSILSWDAPLFGDDVIVGSPLIFVILIVRESCVPDAGRVFLTLEAVEIALKSYHAATSLLAEAEPGLLWPAGVHTLWTLVWTRFDLLANWGDLFSLIVIIGNYTIVKECAAISINNDTIVTFLRDFANNGIWRKVSLPLCRE